MCLYIGICVPDLGSMGFGVIADFGRLDVDLWPLAWLMARFDEVRLVLIWGVKWVFERFVKISLDLMRIGMVLVICRSVNHQPSKQNDYRILPEK